MNILVTNYRDRLHPLAGGAEIHLHGIFARIAAMGHRVVLLTTRYPGALPHDEIDGIRIIREGADWNFNALAFARLPNLIRDLAVDIVVEDLNKIPLFTPLRSRVPVVVQIHHLWKTSIFRESSFAAASLVYGMEGLIPALYRHQRFIAVSPSTKRELVELGIDADRITIIYNGSEPGPGSETERVTRAPYFLWLGRLRKYKGVQVAVDAFERFLRYRPGYELHIAGSGPYRREVEQRIKRLGLVHSVKMWGQVTEDLKCRLMQGARAVLQTSHKEGWGLTVIEAASCGTPAIASRVPGLSDSVRDGITGILFPSGDSEQLAASMLRICSEDGLREELAANCRAYAGRFSWEDSARQTSDLLAQVCGNLEVAGGVIPGFPR